ncbi:hypothetical protein [Mesorhizobium sp. M0870]|uniref:tetratricopeptide repeat protein n=1 Tax=Mesorhizobium sp. M0870 TaxID=2957016 RepID=UPI00333564BF
MSRLNPNDPIAWVELAFAQTVKGHTGAAKRSMTVALHLAPDNRHVLRSASRLFLHTGEKDRAHDLLLRSPSTRTDPWLLAAEIALAEVAERDPRFFKHALRVLDDGGLPPHQITELAGATATRELLDGSRKKAKRMFMQSMVAPTGSSLAQAEWATPRLGAEIVLASRFRSTIEPYEAESFHLYREARFSEVPSACQKWAEVDPFSIRPFEFGSAAAGHAGNIEKAEELARLGLARRPNSPLLVNCLAYALASLGRLDEAELVIKKLKLSDEDKPLALLTAANKGLIEFRRGNFDQGRALYHEASEGFIRIGQRVSSAHARVYLAREAVIAGLPDAKKLVSEAQDAMKSFPNSEAAGVLRSVEIAANLKPSQVPTYVTPPDIEVATRPAPLQRPQIKWVTPGWPPTRLQN